MGGCISLEDSSDDDVGCGAPHPSRRSRQKLSRRRVMQVLAAEAKANEVLYRIEGRMCGNGSSSNACIFTQQGRKGINQDAMIVWENFDSSPDTAFCGVFDGHGPFGHLVARKVRDSLPTKIMAVRSESKKSPAALAAATESSNSSTEELGQKWFAAWRDSFMKSYHTMDKELKAHPTIDCFCSGTTAVTMLLQGKDMLVANVGDSRAVLGTLSADNAKVEAVPLTVDLKPNLPLEAERIKRCKGRVFALEDEPEVARVWLPHDDSPGLAMARAFGDFCLKDFGLIAVPELTYTRITERDQFIVLASDGIWDVLSNQEVVDTIWDAPTRTTAARALVETAVRAWRLKYPTSKVDDCAVVCFFFNKHGTAQQLRQNLSVVSAAARSEPDMEVVSSLATTTEVDIDSWLPEASAVAEFQRSDTLRSGAIVCDAAVLSSSDSVTPATTDAEKTTASADISILKENGNGEEAPKFAEAERSSSEQHPEWSISSDSDVSERAASRSSEDSTPSQPGESSSSSGLLPEVNNRRSDGEDSLIQVSRSQFGAEKATLIDVGCRDEDGGRDGNDEHVELAGIPKSLSDADVRRMEDAEPENWRPNSSDGDEVDRSDGAQCDATSSTIGDMKEEPKIGDVGQQLCQSDATDSNETVPDEGDNSSGDAQTGFDTPVSNDKQPIEDAKTEPIPSNAVDRGTCGAQVVAEDGHSSTGAQSDASNSLDCEEHQKMEVAMCKSDADSGNECTTGVVGEARSAASSSISDYNHQQVEDVEIANQQSDAMSREWEMPESIAGSMAMVEEAASEITVVTDEEEEDEDEDAGSTSAKAVMGRSASRKSLAECLSVADDEEWSALEGVARVNSLLKLPRFLRGAEGRAAAAAEGRRNGWWRDADAGKKRKRGWWRRWWWRRN